MRSGYLILKNGFDFLIALFLSVALLPISIIICLLLWLNGQKEVLFFQRRAGLRSKVFTIVKFKTMNDIVDDEGRLLPDHLRTTSLGRFIRKTSLDEIPQLINVLKGDMSLIGPRPLLVKYMPLYNDFQKRRHEVKPGITGWAQVNGRNAISWDDKFKLDVWYVENISLATDLKILFLTIQKGMRSEGVNQGDNVTMEEFKGN